MLAFACVFQDKLATVRTLHVRIRARSSWIWRSVIAGSGPDNAQDVKNHAGDDKHHVSHDYYEQPKRAVQYLAFVNLAGTRNHQT